MCWEQKIGGRNGKKSEEIAADPQKQQQRSSCSGRWEFATATTVRAERRVGEFERRDKRETCNKRRSFCFRGARQTVGKGGESRQEFGEERIRGQQSLSLTVPREHLR